MLRRVSIEKETFVRIVAVKLWRLRDILDKALSRSITQCYAIEGTYPPDLDYLVEHYGLCYDSETFFIDYRYIGSNLRPDVTIIERTEHATHN